MTKTNEAKQKLRMAGRTLMRCYEEVNTLQGQCEAARKDCLSAERAVGICQEHKDSNNHEAFNMVSVPRLKYSLDY